MIISGHIVQFLLGEGGGGGGVEGCAVGLWERVGSRVVCVEEAVPEPAGSRRPGASSHM